MQIRFSNQDSDTTENTKEICLMGTKLMEQFTLIIETS